MQIGMIGLGRMGSNMVRRLMQNGHSCVVYDRNADAVHELAGEGATGAKSLDQLAERLDAPRAVWIMVPSGEPTEDTVRQLAERLEPDDVIIDGGNSYFKDDVRRARVLESMKLHYVDVGTSGGIWGAERGYCLMIGGEQQIVERLDPIFGALAPGRGEIPVTPGWEQRGSTADRGYLHCGPAGAGHYVKMVHNGIEYGLMQAYAEGFDILRCAATEQVAEERRYNLKLDEVAEVWRRGSVVGSWLLDLTSIALAEDESLDGYSGFVQDSGEGRWTVMTAVEQAVPADVLTASLYTRFRSRQEHTYAEKILSAMRHKFGGHVEKPSGE